MFTSVRVSHLSPNLSTPSLFLLFSHLDRLPTLLGTIVTGVNV